MTRRAWTLVLATAGALACGLSLGLAIAFPEDLGVPSPWPAVALMQVYGLAAGLLGLRSGPTPSWLARSALVLAAAILTTLGLLFASVEPCRAADLVHENACEAQTLAYPILFVGSALVGLALGLVVAGAGRWLRGRGVTPARARTAVRESLRDVTGATGGKTRRDRSGRD